MAQNVSFEEVLSLYAGLISRIALSHEADSGHREDLKQEIVLAVWRALPSFRGDSSLKTFVASIAQKRAITHISRQARHPATSQVSLELPTLGPLPDEQAIAADKRRRLLVAVRSLSVAQRDTATLMLEGFSFQEIADTLGITVNAAMLRCQRAKVAMIERMKEPDGKQI